MSHNLRSDARDNRDRLLEAARALFSLEGLAVPMREVARRAGVGPATLYRHFPTKEALLAEAFAGQLRACEDIVDRASADPDPWSGLCRVIEGICELHARDRGFTEAFLSAYPRAFPVSTGRGRVLKKIADLATRAKRSGHLRPDFVLDDLVLMLLANKGLQTASPAARVAASRRFAGFVIQALAHCPHNAPLPPPVRLTAEHLPGAH
ncbi:MULTISPECIES: TetR/AcrR family transcriptional regulator [Streptomyces]|uniref:TetR/AcrR family transcriptional regulator n=1 Tax=Streptomyces TaxID=1883 RepID=UPI0019B10DB3|nr:MULTISPECIES: TetR/AcrR family transcriptional regulator [Streptomyces]WTD46078.1 TetR/AcrR family transcriptional regulator [Streptomyces thermoviolaceus]GGV80755.1 TetR family transcriptional regulator [Streptomyces thermoviolaceus subsp. apingens]GHA74325.1 TetR family transcriptional regulator [Streptomyces thermoviolaceus subsp. thermoviolaceus]